MHNTARQAYLRWTCLLLILATCVAQPALGQPAPNGDQDQPPPADAMAWALGTNLGIAAVLHQAGAAPAKVDDRMQTVAALAEALGASAPALPQRTNQTDAKFSAEVLHYLLRGVEPLAKHLQAAHSPRHASLFEMAIKSSALAIIYFPGDETGMNVAQVIEDRGKRCQLPRELWKPLADSIRAQATADDVKRNMLQMHSAVQRHLAKAQP